MGFDIVFSILAALFAVLWVFDSLGWVPRFGKKSVDGEPIVHPDGQGLGIVHSYNKKQRRKYASFFAGGFVFCIVVLCASYLFGQWFTTGAAFGDSMVPTLTNSDRFLVNNWSYDLQLPGSEKKFRVGNPKLGDVVSFRYPVEPDKYVLKRVVAGPGDTISYFGKILFVNGKPAPQKYQGVYQAGETPFIQDKYRETLGDIEHSIILRRGAPTNVVQFPTHNAPGFCKYHSGGVECVIPQDQYFVVGDNRDISADSRHWGFVPRELLEGRAFVKWPQGHPFHVEWINTDDGTNTVKASTEEKEKGK
ncbi:MAG: signal peptidase I [Burkholderiales bacterium]|nr:signal peptidase I [Burkholderiales bacterium]